VEIQPDSGSIHRSKKKKALDPDSGWIPTREQHARAAVRWGEVAAKTARLAVPLPAGWLCLLHAGMAASAAPILACQLLLHACARALLPAVHPCITRIAAIAAAAAAPCIAALQRRRGAAGRRATGRAMRRRGLASTLAVGRLWCACGVWHLRRLYLGGRCSPHVSRPLPASPYRCF
jgi:hypothetical protein